MNEYHCSSGRSLYWASAVYSHRYRFSPTSASENQPILIKRKRPLGPSRPKFLYGLRMRQSATMRHGTGSNTPGALLALGISSYAMSRTLMPAARRLSVRSSENGSGMLGRVLLMGLRVKSSVEVGVGPAKGDPSEVVVDDVPRVG